MSANFPGPLPNWEDGDFGPDEIRRGLAKMVAWLRRMRPLAGGEITPMTTADGTYWMGKGSTGGDLIDVKITASITAASWAAGSTGVSTEGSGTCRLVNMDGTIDSTDETIYNRYPDAVTAPRFGKAERKYGKLYLVTASCSAVPA